MSDVPHSVIEYLAWLLVAYRRRIGTPRNQGVLARCREQGLDHVVPNGTLIFTTESSTPPTRAMTCGTSGKTYCFADNVQFPRKPNGTRCES